MKSKKTLQVKGNGRNKVRKPTLAHGIRSRKDIVVRMAGDNGGKQYGVRATPEEHQDAFRQLAERYPGAKMSYMFKYQGVPFRQLTVEDLNNKVRAIIRKGKPAYQDLSDWCRKELFGWDTDK